MKALALLYTILKAELLPLTQPDFLLQKIYKSRKFR